MKPTQFKQPLRALAGSVLALAACFSSSFASPPKVDLPPRSSGGIGLTPADVPPDALPGQCYAKVWVPEITETSYEFGRCIETSAARRETRISPPVYEDYVEQVLIKEAGVERVVIAARYKEVTEQVLVTAEYEEDYIVAAEWRVVQDRVLVRPARMEWKQGTEVFGFVDKGRIREARRNETTGVVWCLVEVEAEYEPVTRRELVREARVEKRKIPAVYKSVTRKVLVEGERIEERQRAAEYQSVTRRRLVKAGYTEVVEVASECKKVPTVVVRKPPTIEWQEVLCEVNATPDIFRRIQSGLRAKGYTGFTIDGRLGPRTLTAIERYQTRENLPTGGLTLTLLESLGIKGYWSAVSKDPPTAPPMPPAPPAPQPAPEIAQPPR